jgi:AraC-like DNA-binding protein
MLTVIVAFMATALALGVGAHARRQRSFGLACLAAWVACTASTAWIIVFLQGTSDPMFQQKRLLIGLINSLAAPLLLTYILHALHGRKLHWLAFTPFFLLVLAAISQGVAINEWFNVRVVIAIEFAYTATAWFFYMRAARADERGWPALPALGVLVAVSTPLLAQILFLFGIGSRVFAFNIPFFVIGVWLAIAIGQALFDSSALRAFVPALAPAADAGDEELFARVDLAMREQRPWMDPELEVGVLARLIGTNANAVSRALSRAGNTNFYDYLNGYRVREAERLLLDPEESRFKIEALGRQAGFRARSTFFKVFRAHTGLTPAEFRRARNPATAE